MKKKFSINFGSPNAGWLEVELINETKKLLLVVSDVPCDSIYGLTKALLLLVKGSKNESVDWSLEPEYSIWKFTSNQDYIELNVASDNKIDFYVKIDKIKMIKTMFRGLKKLESENVWKAKDNQNHEWSWPFPSEKIKELKKEMNKIQIKN